MNSRMPGPLCQVLGEAPVNIKDGTTALAVSPVPGAIGSQVVAGGGSHWKKALDTLQGQAGSLASKPLAAHAKGSGTSTASGSASASSAAAPGKPDPKQTAAELAEWAKAVVLKPPRDRTVLYHGVRGTQRAEMFVRAYPGFVRITDLVKTTKEDGDRLLELLKLDWQYAEPIWWLLSGRLAESSSGTVRVFGDGRYTQDIWTCPKCGRHKNEAGAPCRKCGTDYSEIFKSDFGSRKSRAGTAAVIPFGDTVFEKVEWPALDGNPDVTTVYYNGTDVSRLE
jgi:hypothetical protein